MKRMRDIISFNNELKERNQAMYETVINDPKIKALIRNSDEKITESMIRNDLIELERYRTQSFTCEECSSLDTCVNELKGYIPKIEVRNGRLNIVYTACKTKRHHDEFLKQQKLIQSFHISQDIKDATFYDVYVDESYNRDEVFKQAIQVSKEIINGTSPKGLYIYGAFGVGKSYLLGCIANFLKEKSRASVLVFVPEFISELKSGFKDGTTQEKLNVVKYADVLMLDDLGAEDVTPWVRDEVIMSVLHHRMIHKKPTFITSNFTIEELEKHYQKTKEGIDETKSRRLIERVRALTNSIEMAGPNFRQE